MLIIHLMNNIRTRVIVRIEDTDRRCTKRDRDKEEVGKVNTAAINQPILPINRSNWVRVIQHDDHENGGSYRT